MTRGEGGVGGAEQRARSARVSVTARSIERQVDEVLSTRTEDMHGASGVRRRAVDDVADDGDTVGAGEER